MTSPRAEDKVHDPSRTRVMRHNWPSHESNILRRIATIMLLIALEK